MDAPSSLMRQLRELSQSHKFEEQVAMYPSLTVSIVNFNTWKDTIQCIDSILLAADAKCSVEVRVWDNGRGSRPSFSDPRVTVNGTGENLGFGRGHNENLRNCRTEAIFILNPDTVVPKEALEMLMRVYLLHPEASALAPKLVDHHGTMQSSVRHLPSLSTELARVIGLDGLHNAFSILMDPPLDRIAPVPQVDGAAILLKRKTWERLGGFDSRFFMYFEDVDLCRRLRVEGPILYVPQVSIVHTGQGTARMHRKFTTYSIEIGRQKYHQKYANGLTHTIVAHVGVLSTFSHWVYWSLRWFLRINGLDAKERAIGYAAALAAQVGLTSAASKLVSE